MTIAICSCPRLGFMSYMGHSIAAFINNGIEYTNVFGVYWGQAMTAGLKLAVDAGHEYIVTCDYDSLFDTETVMQLMRLIEQNPHADAVTTMQMGRFSGILLSTESGQITLEELKNNDLVKIKTGHFGLTVIRASSLKEVVKPWFTAECDSDGEWGDEKTDEDTYFWNNWELCGKTLYVAPRLVIGHCELLVKYPDEHLQGIYTTTAHFDEFGKPSDCWK